jgi:hypothetical protein
VYVRDDPPEVIGLTLPCDGPVTIEYVSGLLSGSVAVRVIGVAVFFITLIFWLFAAGGEFAGFEMVKLSKTALLPFL